MIRVIFSSDPWVPTCAWDAWDCRPCLGVWMWSATSHIDRLPGLIWIHRSVLVLGFRPYIYINRPFTFQGILLAHVLRCKNSGWCIPSFDTFHSDSICYISSYIFRFCVKMFTYYVSNYIGFRSRISTTAISWLGTCGGVSSLMLHLVVLSKHVSVLSGNSRDSRNSRNSLLVTPLNSSLWHVGLDLGADISHLVGELLHGVGHML